MTSVRLVASSLNWTEAKGEGEGVGEDVELGETIGVGDGTNPPAFRVFATTPSYLQPEMKIITEMASALTYRGFPAIEHLCLLSYRLPPCSPIVSLSTE